MFLRLLLIKSVLRNLVFVCIDNEEREKYDIDPNKDYCWSCDIHLQNPFDIQEKLKKNGAAKIGRNQAQPNMCLLHEHPLLK